MRRSVSVTVVGSLLFLASFAPAASADRQDAARSGNASRRAMVEYLKTHGYIPIGGPAAYARYSSRAADRAAGLHASAPTTPVAARDPVAGPSWRGLDQDDLAPPDPTGAIGPRSYIEAINLQMGIYDRSGNLITAAPFSVLTGSGDDFLSDPQVIWDAHTSRFYYLILDVDHASMRWGFSKSADPTSIPGSFCNYETDFGWPDDSIPDYPKLGQTTDFLLIGINLYLNLATFVGADVAWVTKPRGHKPITTCPSEDSFLSGKQSQLLNNDGATLSSTPEPGVQVDPAPVGWIVAVPDSTNSGATGTELELYRVTENPDGTANIPQVATSAVTVPEYSPPSPAPQQGSAHTLDTLDGRLIHAVSAIDPTRDDAVALWTSHTVFGGAGAEVRWYEIDVRNGALFQNGAATSPTLFAFNGAVSPDRAVRGRKMDQRAFGQNMVLGFTTSSSTAYPAVQMVSKVGSNPQSGFVLVKQSPGPDDGFDCFLLQRCRWGDYGGAVPDPRAPLTGSTGKVWLSNEWASGEVDPLFATWRTWNWAAKP